MSSSFCDLSRCDQADVIQADVILLVSKTKTAQKLVKLI
jgi:hypothetical protein